MTELLDKNAKEVSIPVLHMFKKLEERLFARNRKVRDINKTQMKLAEIKTIMTEVENTVKGINRRLDTVGKNSSKF